MVAVAAATKVPTYAQPRYDTQEVEYSHHYQPQQQHEEEAVQHYHHQPTVHHEQQHEIQPQHHQYEEKPRKHIVILKSESHTDKDGSYKYAFEAANGIQQQEHGYVKNAGVKDHEIQVAEGYYSYTDEHGHQVGVHYIADENGFRATGDHLPTPPPIPEALREAYAKAQADPDYHEQEPEQEYKHVEEEQPQQSYEHAAYHHAAANHRHHPVAAAPVHHHQPQQHQEYTHEEYKH